MTHEQNNDDELCVFGYGSKIYSKDEHFQRIAEERHLCNWLDTDIRTDRMLLHSITDVHKDPYPGSPECPSEAMEEEMCEAERYREMNPLVDENRSDKKRAEVAFSYDNQAIEPKKEEVIEEVDDSGSDSETEPFETPEGVKLPMGLQCPPNQKLNHIILRTAGFVVEKGVQMEIVIKAKQRNNLEQFGFLEFDDGLNPYYKYMMKMIREKKYTVPDFEKQKKLKKKASNKNSTKSSSNNAHIKAEPSTSDDSGSESDYELHPLLMASMNKSPENKSKHLNHPHKKPTRKSNDEIDAFEYEMDKSNNMYTSLFKSLAGLKGHKEESEASPEVRRSPTLIKEEHGDLQQAAPDVEFQKWWSWFYSCPCPISHPAQIVTPSPDVMQLIDNWAQYVAKHGAEGEKLLREQHISSDANFKTLKFLTSDSPFHSYYQQKVQAFQRSFGIYPPAIEIGLVKTDMVSTSIQDAMNNLMNEIETSAPPPSLNRKQRRRLQDAPRVYASVPIQIIDPIATTKQSASQAAEFSSVSLRFTPRKFDSPTTSQNSDNEPTTTNSKIVIPPAPLPPILQNDIQLERKEKARLFMEKILKEKQQKRKQEQKGRESPKLESNLAILIESGNDKERTEQIASASDQQLSTNGTQIPEILDPINDKNSKEYIESLINKKLNNLLSSTAATSTSKSASASGETKANNGSTEERKHRKSSKKKRSRSRSRSHTKSKRRRRSRSRSRSRDRRDSRRYR
ncbi:unnamed protein product, partial [Mesorhabditis belari]|uniref:SURP motif domain-containing protein n=1 Tax=Mesorhabditis belari TaxID=2138241 RepID=A0AAF3E9S1_9BILA